MIKAWAKKFYNSTAWKKTRESYISKRKYIDGGLCEVCKQNLGYIVHHIEPLTMNNVDDPFISLDHENLSYECKDCHDKHEGHGVGSKSEWQAVFDNDGNPLPK